MTQIDTRVGHCSPASSRDKASDHTTARPVERAVQTERHASTLTIQFRATRKNN